MASTDFSGTPEDAKAETKLPLRPVRRLFCRQNAVRAVRFNADGQYCLTAGGNRTIRLWNPHAGRLLKTYSGHSGEVSDVQSSSDNSQLGSGGTDQLVILWDVVSGQAVRRWRKHAGRVNAVKFAGPSEEAAAPSLLLSAGVDGMLLAWDARARTQYPIQTMHEARDSVSCIAVRRWQILTGSIDRCVRLYDIRKGEMLEDYIGYPVTSVGISFDGQCVLVASQDSTIRLMDALNGELLSKYTGHVNKVFKLDCCFMNQDAQIVSGSEDCAKVHQWDVVTGGEANLVLDHSPKSPAWSRDLANEADLQSELTTTGVPFIHSLCPHPNGNSLLTAGGDYIWLWSDET
ncbi:WD repeat-containing protein 83 [Sparganum proliferum]